MRLNRISGVWRVPWPLLHPWIRRAPPPVLLAWMAVTLGTVLRLVAIPPVVGDVDGVNFARALAHFDPAQQSPHWPGYPVYVLATKVARLVAASETVALALPAAALWPVAALTFFYGVRRHFKDIPAATAVVASSLAPGAVLAGGWPTSDGLGFALLVLGLGVMGLALPAGASKDRGPSPHAVHRPPWLGVMLPLSAGLALGLLMGVRLSWAPIAFAALILWIRAQRSDTRPLVAGFALSGALIAGALLWSTSSEVATRGIATFAEGHFTTWGGTVLVAPGLSRLSRAIWGMWSFALGGAWPHPVPMSTTFGSTTASSWLVALLIVLAVAGLAKRPGVERRRAALFVAVAALTVPYLGWVLLGQNVEKPRHLLPMLPAVGLFLGLGLRAHARHGTKLAMALAAAWLVISSGRALEQGRRLPPAARLIAEVVAEHPPEGLQIFAGEEARVFEHLAPMYRVWRPATPSVLEAEVRAARQRGAEVLITSGTIMPPSLQQSLEPIATFEAPIEVRAHDATLALYRHRPTEAAQPAPRRQPDAP